MIGVGILVSIVICIALLVVLLVVFLVIVLPVWVLTEYNNTETVTDAKNESPKGLNKFVRSLFNLFSQQKNTK